METLTSFKNTNIAFRLGTAFEEYAADGWYTQTVALVEDNKLIKVQTPDPTTGMVLHLSIPSKPEIICGDKRPTALVLL